MTQEQLNKEAESLGIKLLHIDDLTYCMYKDHSYMGYFEWKTGRKFVKYNNRKYASISDLLQDLEEYNNNLEYPIESYNPSCSEEYKKSVKLDYLFSKIGYKTIKELNVCRHTTRRKHNNILGVDLSCFDNGNMILTETSWIPIFEESEDIDTIKEKLYGMITVIYSNIIGELTAELSKINRIKHLESIKIKQFIPNTMQVVEYEGTRGIVELLENTVKELKETLNK